MACVPDYSSYFAFPRGRLQNSGYSGVATYCRESTQCRPWGVELSFILECEEIFDKKWTKYAFDELDEEHQFATRWPRVYETQTQIGLAPSLLGVNFWKNVDSEGRCVVSKFEFTIDTSDASKKLFVFNVYCPRNDSTRPERRHFQLRFYHMLEMRAFQLLKYTTFKLNLIKYSLTKLYFLENQITTM
jgi:exonuclease III